MQDLMYTIDGVQARYQASPGTLGWRSPCVRFPSVSGSVSASGSLPSVSYSHPYAYSYSGSSRTCIESGLGTTHVIPRVRVRVPSVRDWVRVRSSFAICITEGRSHALERKSAAGPAAIPQSGTVFASIDALQTDTVAGDGHPPGRNQSPACRFFPSFFNTRYSRFSRAPSGRRGWRWPLSWGLHPRLRAFARSAASDS
jgi:hypothetical protein